MSVKSGFDVKVYLLMYLAEPVMGMCVQGWESLLLSRQGQSLSPRLQGVLLCPGTRQNDTTPAGWKKGHCWIISALKVAFWVGPQKMLYFIPSHCKTLLRREKEILLLDKQKQLGKMVVLTYTFFLIFLYFPLLKNPKQPVPHAGQNFSSYLLVNAS